MEISTIATIGEALFYKNGIDSPHKIFHEEIFKFIAKDVSKQGESEIYKAYRKCCNEVGLIELDESKTDLEKLYLYVRYEYDGSDC